MMRFRLLGPVEVRAGEDWRGIGAPKWRSVLAALLIYPGQIVSAETLISELWRDEPPARAANLVSIYVLRLRRLMDDPDGRLLVTRSPGYLLRVSGDETDALLFEAMVRDGRRAFAAGDPEGAASRLTEALGLWYGRPLADVPPTPLVEAEAERLAELRLGAVELRITAELALGGHEQAVSELRRLLADHPLREGLWLLLMRALDGAGRHAEALEVYGQARDAISEQLGVDPGAELRQLHAELLAKDTAAPVGVITAGVVSPPAEPAPEPRQARGAKRGGAQGPAQLPADVADFTGRDEQVKRLSDLLSGTGARGQVPDHAGPPPDAGSAGQRARRGPGQAAAAGLRVVRGAGHDPEPDARPGQHQAGRPQRARRRRGAEAVRQGGGRAATRGRTRGHRRTARCLRRPAAGDQDLRGPAGHPQRLDRPGDGRPAPRRAPQAGRDARRGPRGPRQLPGELHQPASQHRQAGHRPGPRVLPARPVAGPLDFVRRGGGSVRHPRVLGRGCAGGPGRHPPAGIGGHGPVPVPRPAPGLCRRTGRRRPVRGRAGRRGHPPARLVHAHRRRRRLGARAASLQHPAGR